MLPDAGELERILARVSAVGLERSNGAAVVRDPSGNAVRLTAA